MSTTSNKMEHLVIHCTDSAYLRPVTPDEITMWHMGPLRNNDGTYTYLGKKYKPSELSGLYLTLPSGNRVAVKTISGRGWTQVGYADMITPKGDLINLVPYNGDDVIDSSEVTNGAVGYNKNSRHVVMCGGWSKQGNKTGRKSDGSLYLPEELYSFEAIQKLKEYIKMQLELVNTAKVKGHNELCTKTCPNFDVQRFVQKYF